MRRDLWMILILGCLLILLLEAPAAFSSVTTDLSGPYPPEASPANAAATPVTAEVATPHRPQPMTRSGGRKDELRW